MNAIYMAINGIIRRHAHGAFLCGVKFYSH